WLFAALHRAGVGSQAESVDAADGLTLRGVRMAAAVRCAPPANKPTPTERDTCAPWLRREIELLPDLRVMLALGGFGWQAALAVVRGMGWQVPRPAPRFGHGATAVLTRPDGAPVHLLGCYHVSQQNTQTGRLTEAMLDALLVQALSLAHP
uniref:uracil-DNA glycosylase family protein n=1 Tax=Actinotalea sp. C106 TaxID=2908644 RepID=UPI00254138A2